MNKIVKKIGEIAKITKGSQLNKKELSDNGMYPVINGGISPSGYWDEYNFNENLITISQGGASAGYVNFITTKFWAGAHCYVVESCTNDVDYKYLYFFLKENEKKLQSTKVGAGIPGISLKDINDMEIYLPSIEEQERIVKILSNFTNIIDAKENEKNNREKQYSYLVNKLLLSKSSNKKRISDFCTITKGKTPIQKAVPGEYPLVVTTQERKSCNEYQFDGEAICIPLVSSRGHGIASLNHVYYQTGKFALGNILCAIEISNKEICSPKYLYYYFENTKDYSLVPLMKGGANVSLHMNDIYNIDIPLPLIKQQDLIIDKLDKIIKYKEVLSKEIELRKQQYEYYRNKLLSFEELSVSE